MTPDHLLAAVLDQTDGIAGPILTRVGVEPSVVRARIGDQLGRLPQAFGGAEPTIDRTLREALEAADRQRADMGDEYLSVEHVLLALADHLGVERDALLPRSATSAAATGSPRRTPRRRSRPSRSTAGTSRPWPARGRWTRSSGATKRSAG